MNKIVNRKILLIGWDGADWKTINPLIERGLMPNLERLIEMGTIGNLATLDPPYSPMLWTSIATGKRPYKHGVLGFSEPDPAGGQIRPVLSLSRKCKAIWNILTQQEYRTHVVGWWPSHPAEPINGIAISNFYQKTNEAAPADWLLPPNAVHPAELESTFKALRIHPDELTAAHLQPFIPELHKLGRQGGRQIRQLSMILAENSGIHAAFTHILRTREWDFATVYYDGIDRICHEFMKYHPPRRPHIPKDEFDLFKDVVTGIYRYSDMMLGRLMDLAGEDTVIMLVSDHGFQPDHLRPRSIPHEPAGIAYEHSPYGIFCACGPGIKKDSLVHGAGLLDITPTLLHLLDLPVGEDMDGTPLLTIFEKPQLPRTIPSWEDVAGAAGMPTASVIRNPSALDQMLDQLVDLGYLERPHQDPAKALQQTRRFCDSNLARAYLDGGQIGPATHLFEKLHEEQPNAPWIAYRLAVCYQLSGAHAACRHLIEQLKAGQYYESAFLDTMEVSLLMGEGNYPAALELLHGIAKRVPDGVPQIYLKIGQCYSLLGKPEEAAKALEKELQVDFDNAAAHQYMGNIHFNQQRYEQATDSLLTAIGLDYSLAAAHYTLGRTLLAQGFYLEAADALRVTLGMAPFNNHARHLLAYTYRTHLDDPALASQVMQDFKRYLLGEVVVVSGLPRSGTSMLMQMLDQGGMPLFTDGIRAADDNNPLGYYEHEVVKKITHNTHWLQSARDKVVKVVAPLVTQLPYNYRYKVIYMERNPYEIHASQQRMLGRLGIAKQPDTLSVELINQLRRTSAEAKRWMERHPSVEVLYLQYQEVLSTPLEQAIRINDFLQQSLHPLAMVTAVIPSLRRERPKKTVQNSTEYES